MATAHVTTLEASVHHTRNTNVIPLPFYPTVEIPQSKLYLIILLRNERGRLQEQLEAAEGEVRAALEAHAPVQPCVHVATLKEAFRRSVSWREVAERLGDRLYGECKGAPYCER